MSGGLPGMHVASDLMYIDFRAPKEVCLPLPHPSQRFKPLCASNQGQSRLVHSRTSNFVACPCAVYNEGARQLTIIAVGPNLRMYIPIFGVNLNELGVVTPPCRSRSS